MAKKVSTTVIGGFVISAIVLLITAVILFGSGSFWTKTEQYVLYFEESVKGLGVGSAVMFRGVQVGTVKTIVLRTDQEKMNVNIPVTIEINENKFQNLKREQADVRTHVDKLIKLGLRARLDMQSIVTGQLIVQLDLLPDTPVKISGLDNEYPEIPTLRSSLGKLTSMLKDLPVQKIAGNLLEISEHVNELLASRKIDQILDSLDSAAVETDKLIADADVLVRKVDGKVDSLSEQVENTIQEALVLLVKAEDSFSGAADSATTVLTNINQEVQPISSRLIKTLNSAQKALNQANSTLVTVDGFIDHSDTRIKLNRSLDEISAAARSLGDLADYLERHPEALLKGKNRRGN